ncbi:MAG TPA: carboxypeptidase-like regulatory domain-containing protein [Candidatus Acidoferrum sp.]
MRRVLVSTMVLLVALVAAQNSAAQRKGSGVLSGVVLGPDDRPVPHASVSYQSSAGTAPHAVHADSQGHFMISKLRSDNYDLRASGRGVFSEWEKNVTVRSGQTKSVTLRLIYAKKIPKEYTKSKARE